MRSLLSFGASTPSASAGPGISDRPEILRRKTLATNARIIVLLSLMVLPVGLFLLLKGILVPFLVATICLTAGMGTLALHRRGDYERAAFGQVAAIFATGAVLTTVDPQIVDFGLAITLLGPILASLLGQAPLRKLSWMALAGIVALNALASIVWGAELHEAVGDTSLLAGIAFAAFAGIVALSSNRVSSVYAVFERGQVNAFRHLVDNLQDAVVRFSAQSEVLYVSRGAEAIFGCKLYELTDTGIIERVHVADRPAFLTAFADANISGKPRTLQLRMRRDDPLGPARAPSFIWMSAAFSPVGEAEPGADRYEVVALFHDISTSKDNEASLDAARKAAEDANEAKSRFLAVIGHELRTPLNAIVGFAEMMSSDIGGELSPTHREYAGLIHQSGHHLLDVVKMLLDMSKIEAGKFEIQADTFNPEELVGPCLKIVEPMAQQRKVWIDLDIAPSLPVIVADERACRQVLINLLSNAIKFSHADGHVGLSMHLQGQKLVISVTDAGIGMAPEAIRRLGEPFFQADDGLTRSYEGTGLGLSIVKGLLDLHHGSLHVLSAPGEGTTMTVFLPINGPETKSEQTGSVTPLRREPVSNHSQKWHDQKRKAL